MDFTEASMRYLMFHRADVFPEMHLRWFNIGSNHLVVLLDSKCIPEKSLNAIDNLLEFSTFSQVVISHKS